MTPDYVALLRESALRDEVFPKDMVALCDEVERGWAGMRQLLADRDAARAELAELVRRLRNVDLLGLHAWLEEHDR